MVHTYTPTYYTSLHDSITSICKNILPFSFKKKRIPAIAAAEQRLSQQQSDNLKWQQETFHQILKLMGLCKEGILPEMEVSAFRTHLLETIIASPIDHEPSLILRDKLIFLQELLYANCISEDEYHDSKRPLLQRLAVQGAEIEASDIILGTQNKVTSNDEWSVIDLKEEKCLVKPKEASTLKKIKGAATAFGFVTPVKNGKLDEKFNNEVNCSTENPFWSRSIVNVKDCESKSILMVESSPMASMAVRQSGSEKGKRKPFKALFSRDQKENECNVVVEGKEKGKKKTWGFDGLKKWKKNESEDETAPLSLDEKSDGLIYTGQLIENPIGEGPDTTQMKRKLHPTGAPTDFFVDKVLGDNIRKELSRIQTELRAKDQNVDLSDDKIEAIATRLPVDKADLQKFFSKSWCNQYGDVVLDVVRKEFKDHVGEMGSARAIVREKNNSKRWTTFDDEENSHPNLFAPQQDYSYSMKRTDLSASKGTRASFNNTSIDTSFKYNPFFDM